MRHGIRKVFLHPGDFVFGETGTHVPTVLGSCIVIGLWHPLLRIGGPWTCCSARSRSPKSRS